MSQEYVWNISDHPNTDVKPMVISVLGKSVSPGQFIKVDAASLKSAHQVKKLEEAQIVFIGRELPPEYKEHKSPVRAALSGNTNRSHGVTSKKEVAKEVSKAVDSALKEEKLDYFKKKKGRF
jgi:hypothetical protein